MLEMAKLIGRLSHRLLEVTGLPRPRCTDRAMANVGRTPRQELTDTADRVTSDALKQVAQVCL